MRHFYDPRPGRLASGAICDYFMSHRHRRRFGVFGGGLPGGMGMGGGAFLAGKRLAAADLQLVLLALLAERPSHGYELIKALGERSGGFYSPSPGMVYPALTWLEEVGYASVAAEGAKKLYSITDAGRAYLNENREATDAMLNQLGYIGRKMGRVREIFGGFDEDEEADAQGMGAARRELRQALREKRGVSADEKLRIAQILRDAAARIRGKS
ncbi:MAG TPA: PadR family transcriptional regulator [Steroidobacteraceae bacterium]|jgi:DNA-binding PadR family transcriptional regulator|nr:PadR family transcriptional regulator [Steroidobacteraceae bacterium]